MDRRRPAMDSAVRDLNSSNFAKMFPEAAHITIR
jgi:hypothetical protein